MKIALLSMDLEDWFDLKYLEPKVRSREVSLCDGVHRFLEFLGTHRFPATFFVLGTFWESHRALVRELADAGYEIALHGADHRLLYEVPDAEFQEITRSIKHEIEDGLGNPVDGFRASCFSMTPSKLDILQELGFRYDSSRTEFPAHYVQETLDMSGWNVLAPGVYERSGFVEFDLTSRRIFGKTLQVAGGGYFRLFPWPLFRALVRPCLRDASVYTFYLHPFETSSGEINSQHVAWTLADRVRFQVGRRRVMARLQRLASLLQAHHFEPTTHRRALQTLLSNG